MRFKTIFFIFALAMLMLAGALGKSTSKAEAQDEIVLTATSLTRIGFPDQSTAVIDMDVGPDGNYLAMLGKRIRRPMPGDNVKCLIGQPCFVTERVLVIYEITTDPYTIICSKNYPVSGLSHSVVKFTKHDGRLFVAVLEGSQLSFYDNVTCQEVGQTQLPESFVDPYELDAYSTFDVAYTGTVDEPLIIVIGGVYDASSQDPIEFGSGLIVGVAWDPIFWNPFTSKFGDFVVNWTEIVDSAPGIFAQIKSETAADGTITSVLLSEQYLDYEALKDYVGILKGSTQNFPGIYYPQFAAVPRQGNLPSTVAFANDEPLYVRATGGLSSNWLEITTSGTTGYPDVCLTPQPPNPIAPIPYPDGVSVSKVPKKEVVDSKVEYVKIAVIGKTEEGVSALDLIQLAVDKNPELIARTGLIFPGAENITNFLNDTDRTQGFGFLEFDGAYSFTFHQLSSTPLGGSGWMDSGIIEFNICTAPITFANLKKIDDGDEEGDQDKGMFEVSFDFVDLYECEPIACTAELVCQDGKSIAVEQDQLVEIKIEDDKCKIENNDGRLVIKGQVKLVATCSNETGSSVAEALPEGLTEDENNDEQGEDDS
jgi:hypothetical protein